MAAEATMAVSANAEEPNVGRLSDLNVLNPEARKTNFKIKMSHY
jgi:hypothetical protein